MRYLIIALLFVSVSAFGQKNRYKAPGTAYTTGTPNFVPVRGTEGEVAIDSLTGKWWQYSYQENAWKHLGYWVTETGTSGAPTYTPNKVTSPLAINNGDSLYHYRAGSWRLVSGGGGGSSEGGGIYGPSDTVTYQHNAVVDSGLTFSSAEDTAYLNILMAPGTFGTGAYFNADSIRLRKYDLAGSNEVRLNTSGITLLTTTPDRVTIQGADSRYAADYRATYNDRSLIDKGYADDTYLQGIDTFSVSNDTLFLSLSRDSVPASFVVLPAGSGSDNQTLSIDSTTVGNIERFAVSISNGNTVRFDVNQDQTVVLNEGYGINNSGTYPNFTIAADTTELATVNDINIVQAADDIPLNQIAYGTGTGITGNHTIKVNQSFTSPISTTWKIRGGASNDGSNSGFLADSISAGQIGFSATSVSNNSTDWYAQWLRREVGSGDIVSVIQHNSSGDAIQLISAAAAGGDPLVQFAVGATNVAIGIDNSDSDIWKVDYASALDATYAIGVNSSNLVGIGGAPVTGKALTVTGEVQITDLNAATTATVVLGADGSGNVESLGLSGMSVSSGTLTATDGSLSNEGTLGVSAGASNTSVITSNTSGATGVTIAVAGTLSISESTASNGGTITITGTGAALTDGDKGDIDVTSSGTVWTVDTSAITLIKMASNSVDSTKVATGAISVTDIGQHGATSGQVLKWNGTQWAPDTDNNDITSAPSTQVISGTGTGVTSSADFTHDISGNIINVADTIWTSRFIRVNVPSGWQTRLTNRIDAGINIQHTQSDPQAVTTANLAYGVFAIGNTTTGTTTTACPNIRFYRVKMSGSNVVAPGAGETIAMFAAGSHTAVNNTLESSHNETNMALMMTMTADSVAANGTIATGLRFWTKDVGGSTIPSGTQAMHINKNQNVGIGTNANATNRLFVSGTPRFDLGSDATGDIFYRNSSGDFTRLGIGSSGQVLTVSGGLPSWQPSSGSDTNIYNTDGNVKDGGTVVDVSGNDPIIFNLDASSTETNTMTRYYVDLTGDDLYTHFTQYVTPQDSLYITSFDSGISIDYEGTPASGVGFTISSNTIMNLTADSILVQTLPTRTTLPFMVGLQGNTLSKIEGTADGQVLVWDETNGGFWEIGTSSGGVSDGDKGDIDVTSGGTVWTVDTSAITSLKILDGTVANADLASGVGGIYKGDGTLPAGTTNALLPASGIFRLEYDGANAGLIVDDINSATTIFSKDGTQFFSADNTQSIIGSGTSKMEYIDGVLRMYDSDATHRISIQTPATGSLTANYTLTLPVDDGADNQFLKTDGSGNTSWATIVMPPGTENIESSTFTALKGIINQVDCSAGTITVNPPASPVIGDRFSLTDATASAGTNNITVDFDTANQNLYGAQQNYILNVDGGYVEFIYMGATTGWIATK